MLPARATQQLTVLLVLRASTLRVLSTFQPIVWSREHSTTYSGNGKMVSRYFACTGLGDACTRAVFRVPRRMTRPRSSSIFLGCRRPRRSKSPTRSPLLAHFFQRCIPVLLPALLADFSARLWQRYRGRDGPGAIIHNVMPRQNTPTSSRKGNKAQPGSESASNPTRSDRLAAANAARAARVDARDAATKPAEAPAAPAARAGEADADVNRRDVGTADKDLEGGAE